LTVTSLTPSSAAICLFIFPNVTRAMTSRSQAQSVPDGTPLDLGAQRTRAHDWAATGIKGYRPSQRTWTCHCQHKNRPNILNLIVAFRSAGCGRYAVRTHSGRLLHEKYTPRRSRLQVTFARAAATFANCRCVVCTTAGTGSKYQGRTRAAGRLSPAPSDVAWCAS